MDWDTCRHAFVPDSFPRCVRAQGLTLAHWNRYYRLLRKTQATLRFYKDGEREPLPEHLTDAAFRSPHRFMLEVDLAGLKLIWRLREIRELQFEFSPAAISTPERAVLLFRIMSTLGRRSKTGGVADPSLPGQNAVSLLSRLRSVGIFRLGGSA